MTAVAEAAAELADAIEAALACITEPDQDTPAMITGAHGGTGSRPPWNPQAATAYFGATQAIRTLEAELTITVTGHPARPRGGSHANTIDAITMITRLTTDPGTARQLHRIATPCDRLPARDQATRWIPIRLTPGEPRPPLCPYCGHPSLRLADRAYVVMCFYPHCQDGDGRRPFARLDVNRLNGEPMLIWNDEAG